jgi:hypothetical protein
MGIVLTNSFLSACAYGKRIFILLLLGYVITKISQINKVAKGM